MSVTEILTEATSPCGCDGTGAIRQVTREPEDTFRPIGDTGLGFGPSSSYSTSLCSCRKELPPRRGTARWWTSKTVFSAEWEASIFDETASIYVLGEVPVDDENRIVHRTIENGYWPSSVAVDFSDPEMHWLFPSEARELGRLLIQAADAADAYDIPVRRSVREWLAAKRSRLGRWRTRNERPF